MVEATWRGQSRSPALPSGLIKGAAKKDRQKICQQIIASMAVDIRTMLEETQLKFEERRLQSELSGGRTHFMETCGLPISTYFSALKLLWLMENVDAVKDAVQTGDALFGTIDTRLIWNLTGGVVGE